MKTVVELADKAALVEHLREQYGDFEPVSDARVKVEWYAYDSRIDWQTYIVTLNEGAVGFTDGPVP